MSKHKDLALSTLAQKHKELCEAYDYAHRYVEIYIDGNDYVQYDTKTKTELVRRPATNDDRKQFDDFDPILDVIVQDPKTLLIAEHQRTHHGNLYHVDCPICHLESPQLCPKCGGDGEQPCRCDSMFQGDTPCNSATNK